MIAIVGQFVINVKTGVTHRASCASLRFVPPHRLRAANLDALGARARLCANCFELPDGSRRDPLRVGALDERGIHRATARQAATRVLQLLAAFGVPLATIGRFLSRLPGEISNEKQRDELAAVLLDTSTPSRDDGSPRG